MALRPAGKTALCALLLALAPVSAEGQEPETAGPGEGPPRAAEGIEPASPSAPAQPFAPDREERATPASDAMPPAESAAQDRSPRDAAQDETVEATPRGDGEEATGLVPPRPIGEIRVPYPAGVPLEAPVEVRVLLRIDESGAVIDVQLIEGAGSPWDETVLEACRSFRFEPARWNGEPVAVEIPFEQRFEPPVAPRAEAEREAPDASIRGQVVEMGTRRSVAAAVVVATDGVRAWRTETDGEGKFRLEVGAGSLQVEVEIPGYRRFVVREELESGQELLVRYLVERISYHPFEQTVIGKAARQEVTRTTLREREIRRVPGTFGEPFRVISAMPGVSQVFSLLDYPIVRGASPGTTGILLDGDRIPQLFHYLAGPAVIHPEFLDRVDFYPGSFPLEYGGYTGGIIDGITRPARPDERRIEIGVDLLNSSLFLRQPILGATGTIAGRYGYPALLLSAFSEDTYASYWDYQARLDGTTSAGRWSIFAYGAFDEVGSVRDGRERTDLQSLFHRLTLRWEQGDATSFDRYELGIGMDRLITGEEVGEEDDEDPDDPFAPTVRSTQSLTAWTIHPRVRWRRPIAGGLSLRGGADLQWRRSESALRLEEEDRDLIPPASLLQMGLFLEAPWWITEDLLVTPGSRLDFWDTDRARRGSVDPRVNWRWRVQRSEAAETWLKGGVGIFHQPPRAPIPIPGTSELLLQEGLPAAAQTSLGVEIDLASGYLFDVQTYFNYMDPIFLDLEVNGPPGDEEDDYDPRTTWTGRAYGLEVMLRRRDRGDLFGWIAYTLSRSERRYHTGWEPFDFDRTHMLQMVTGIRLPRDWELGGRLQLASGRPLTPPGEPMRRSALFSRFDLRIDRRAVYRNWMLDFYVELVNATISAEQVSDSDEGVRYIFPTVGFRAVL